MKKNITLIITLCLAMISIRAGDENEKKDKPLTDIFLWETTTPVPEKMKPGFESISAKDTETYLRFLASDLLEGRDTSTNMYDIAAEFAAVLFRLWEINPAGNFPVRRFGRTFDRLKKTFTLLLNIYGRGDLTPTLTDKKNHKLQDTNPKGSHGLHRDSFKLQTMTTLIKSFCRGVQMFHGGSFFKKSPPRFTKSFSEERVGHERCFFSFFFALFKLQFFKKHGRCHN